MKKFVCLMMLVGVLLVVSLSATAETYTLDMLPSIGWAPYKVAELKGLWKKQNVDVKLVEYKQPLDVFHSAVHRRLDFVPLPMAVTTTLRNADVFDAMYLGTLSIADQHKYLLLKKELVNKSLKGQTIGTYLADFTNSFLLSSYLKTIDTDLSDVRLVEMSPDELDGNFRCNRLQVVLNLDRGGHEFAEKTNGVIAISTHDFYEPHGLAVIKEGGSDAIPPDDLKKILRGCVDAIEWIRDPANWDEYTSILREHVFVDMPALTDAQILELTKTEKFVNPQTLLQHNKGLLHDYFTRLQAFLSTEGNVKADVLNAFTYDNVIYNQILIEVLQEYVK